MHAAIIELAHRQHGVFARWQAVGDGVSVHNVDKLLRSGRILRVSRAVYRPAGAPLTPEGELVAATLRCGPDAIVVGERPLALLGVRTADRQGDFTVLTRPGRSVTGIDWRWREDPIPGQHRAEIAKVASATPIRNLVEAAVDVGDAVLERLVHGARWLPRGLRGLDELAAAHPHHPGVVRLLGSGLVDAAASESPAESELERVLTGLGAVQQVWVTPTIRVDFLFPDAWLVLERDGRAPHSGPGARARDIDQTTALQAMGLAVKRITAEHVRQPAVLREEVEGLLAVLGGRATPFIPDGSRRTR